MAGKVLVNLTTGMEDGEKVTVAFLVAARRWAAAARSRSSSPRRRSGSRPGTPRAVCEGCPPLDRLFAQFAEGGGELLACPFCVDSRGLDADGFVANARVAGATPMLEWLGDEPGQIFSY